MPPVMNCKRLNHPHLNNVQPNVIKCLLHYKDYIKSIMQSVCPFISQCPKVTKHIFTFGTCWIIKDLRLASLKE